MFLFSWESDIFLLSHRPADTKGSLESSHSVVLQPLAWCKRYFSSDLSETCIFGYRRGTKKYWNWSILVKTQIHKSAIPTNYTKWQCLMRRAPTLGGELVSYRLQSLCSRAHTDTNGKHVSVRRAAVVRRKQSLKEIPSWQCLCVAVQHYVMAWENGKEHHRGCTEMENEKQGKRSQWRWKWEYVLINNGRSEKQYSIL